MLETVSVPAAVFAAVGLNCTLSVTDMPGFSTMGMVPPDAINPAPETTAEFTVTGSNPVELRTID